MTSKRAPERYDALTHATCEYQDRQEWPVGRPFFNLISRGRGCFTSSRSMAFSAKPAGGSMPKYS